MQRLGGDDRPLGLLVDVRQQRRKLVGGQEQAVALVVLAMDRHPDAVQQARGRDHHLGVALAHPVVGDDARDHAAAKQQSREAQADVDDDLDVDPAVVRHAEPPGRVDGRHVPPRLELLVGVRGLEQPLETPVAARRGPHADLGERLPRWDRRFVAHFDDASSSTPSRMPPRPTTSGGSEQLRDPFEDQQAGGQQPRALGVDPVIDARPSSSARPPAASAPARARAG